MAAAARQGSAARIVLRLAMLTGAAAAGWILLTAAASDQAVPIFHSVVDSVRPVVADTAPAPADDVLDAPDTLDAPLVDTASPPVADQPGPIASLLAALTQPDAATHQTVGVQDQPGAGPQRGSFAVTLFGDMDLPVSIPPASPDGGSNQPHGGNPVVAGGPGPPAIVAASTLPRPCLDVGHGRDGDDRRRDSRQPAPGSRPG
jgi:hypothetical protein